VLRADRETVCACIVGLLARASAAVFAATDLADTTLVVVQSGDFFALDASLLLVDEPERVKHYSINHSPPSERPRLSRLTRSPP
jgi:hypothetical protein